MEETKNNAGMSLFDSANDLEINFNDLSEDFTEDQIPVDDNTPPTDDTTPTDGVDPNDINKPNEDPEEDPENVVGDEDPGGENTDDDSPNLYSSFASVLSKQGLLPSLDLTDKNLKIETEDDLANIVKSEIDTQSKDWIVNKIGIEGYEALEKGISLAEYQQHQDNVLTLDGITTEDIQADLELSKKIIYQDYLAQGMDEARAQRFLKKSIDAGEETIIEDAIESLGSLKVSEAKRMEQLAIQREEEVQKASKLQEKIDNDLKNAIYNKDEYIKGLKVNKATQDRVYQSITKIVGKSPDGTMENQLMKDRRENPTEFDSKLYYLYEMTKGFKDFSLIVNKTTSKASSGFERALKGMKFDDAGTKPGFLESPESYGGIGSEIVF